LHGKSVNFFEISSGFDRHRFCEDDHNLDDQ
jgi:hypothetical protein